MYSIELLPVGKLSDAILVSSWVLACAAKIHNPTQFINPPPQTCGPIGRMVCRRPSRTYIALPQEHARQGVMTVSFQVNRVADAYTWNSFIYSEFVRCCLDHVLSDRLVSRVHSHAVFAHSMRTMLHKHRHKTSLLSIPNRRGGADCVGHSLYYRCLKWQSHHILCDTYPAQQFWMEHDRSYDRVV